MSNKEEVFNRLKELIVNMDEAGTKKATEDALAQGLSAQDIISKGLALGMKEVGDRYERRESFLPEVLISADVMKLAMSILQPYLVKAGVKSAGKVVIGCSFGDIHDIGKNIVVALLESSGFTVYDLGPDVAPELFLEKVQEVDADVLAMSAMVSVAVSDMGKTISMVKDRGLPTKLIVGGGAVTEDTADYIVGENTATYCHDAWLGLEKIEEFVKGRR